MLGVVDDAGQMCPPRNQAHRSDREEDDPTIRTESMVGEKEPETRWLVKPSQTQADCCGAQRFQSMATQNDGCLSMDEEADFECRMKSTKVVGKESPGERRQGVTMDRWDHAED